MRSIWKGHIRFSLVNIPIQVFSAVETKDNISFRQLHNKDHGKINYTRTCNECKEEVAYGDIVKGYEYQPDQYVIFKDDELDKVKLKSTKAVDIEAFVNADEVHPSRYENVYYVGPQGAVAQKTFALFNATLKQTGKAGIGRIILREREDVVMIAPHGHGLIMYKLRYPYEIRDIADVPDLDEAPVEKDQLKLAETLVASLERSFTDIDFTDRYKDALDEMVSVKVAGKEVVSLEESEAETPVIDIMDALKASIEAAKKKAN